MAIVDEVVVHADHTVYHIICIGQLIISTVTSSAAVVATWLENLVRHRTRFTQGLAPMVMGLGVRWSPNGAASTLHLCDGRKCLIFQLEMAEECPDRLRHFLANPLVIFVGVWNSLDRAMLRESPHALEVHGLEDMRVVANRDLGYNLFFSKAALAEKLFGWPQSQLAAIIENEVVVRSTNWAADVLSEEQVVYATHESFASARIGIKIFSRIIPGVDYPIGILLPTA